MRRKFNLFVCPVTFFVHKCDRHTQFRHGVTGCDTSLYGQGHRNDQHCGHVERARKLWRHDRQCGPLHASTKWGWHLSCHSDEPGQFGAAASVAAVIVPMPQVTIDPVAVTLRPGGTQTFAATVSGLTNTAVNFTIQEGAGGLINNAGLYTAPTASGLLSCRRHQYGGNDGHGKCNRYRDDLSQWIYAYRESRRGAGPAHCHLAVE